LGWIQKLFIACFWHKEGEEAKCSRRDRGKEEETRIGTKVMSVKEAEAALLASNPALSSAS
jgi:hypothetical protein